MTILADDFDEFTPMECWRRLADACPLSLFHTIAPDAFTKAIEDRELRITFDSRGLAWVSAPDLVAFAKLKGITLPERRYTIKRVVQNLPPDRLIEVKRWLEDEVFEIVVKEAAAELQAGEDRNIVRDRANAKLADTRWHLDDTAPAGEEPKNE